MEVELSDFWKRYHTFFDESVLSAPDNRLPLYKRIFKPGMDDLALIGFAQVIPTLFPFVELQSKLVARYRAAPSEMAMRAPMLRPMTSRSS